MFYEEAMIDGALHWRGTPNGKWEPCRPARLNAVIAELRAQPSGFVLGEDDVEWVVNDNAELGVRIRGQCFFLYKGNSLVYETAKHDDGTPMFVRTVGKREFGECCHPINYSDPSRIGTVSLSDSDR